MKFGSLFSGVGGFDLGFERAGMECAWQAERDKFALQVLNTHWPNVRKYEDVRDVGRNAEPVDLICGGFPCQDLSVAGKRAGLAGERSGLWFEFRRIIEELVPTWVVIENVPGLLSSNKGGDMAVLLGGLAQLGYGWAYRVLDSQYFGVAQRRRRVFIVGHIGDAASAAKVLFEPESRDWDSAPRRKKGQENTRVAGTLASSGGGLDRPAGNANELDFAIPALTGWDAESKRIHSSEGVAPTIAGSDGKGGQRMPYVSYIPEIARAITSGEGLRQKVDQDTYMVETAKALKAGASKSYQGVGVRRLTPIECERLQGFPDGWTGEHSDTQRYKMMGNAVTVNVAEWIGRRIMAVA